MTAGFFQMPFQGLGEILRIGGLDHLGKCLGQLGFGMEGIGQFIQKQVVQLVVLGVFLGGRRGGRFFHKSGKSEVKFGLPSRRGHAIADVARITGNQREAVRSRASRRDVLQLGCRRLRIRSPLG